MLCIGSFLKSFKIIICTGTGTSGVLFISVINKSSTIADASVKIFCLSELVARKYICNFMPTVDRTAAPSYEIFYSYSEHPLLLPLFDRTPRSRDIDC